MTSRPPIAPRLVALVIGLLATLSASAADVVVVVSARNSELHLSREQIAEIFLGRIHRMGDGQRVVAIDRSEGSPEREAFYQTYIRRSPAQVKAHWSKIIFTGRGQPPRQVADDAEAKQQLADNPAAITYLERAQLDASVREVSRP